MPATAHDANDLKGIYHGTVVDNVDPLRLGRVRFEVPGLIEPKSAWAFPAGGLMGGIKGRGSFSVPKMGADVVCVFVGGDADVPLYFSGWYGENERPAYLDNGGDAANPVPVAPEDVHKVTIIEDDRWEVVLDSRGPKAKLRLRDKLTDDEILMEKGGINIQATSLVNITSTGTVNIDGANVSICERPVIRNGKPIE